MTRKIPFIRERKILNRGKMRKKEDKEQNEVVILSTDKQHDEWNKANYERMKTKE